MRKSWADIPVCERAAKRQKGKRMGKEKKWSEKWARILLGCQMFLQANNKKWSGQGRKAGAYTSLAPDECVSLSESDIKTPDGPCLAFFPERESMRVRDI